MSRKKKLPDPGTNIFDKGIIIEKKLAHRKAPLTKKEAIVIAHAEGFNPSKMHYAHTKDQHILTYQPDKYNREAKEEYHQKALKFKKI